MYFVVVTTYLVLAAGIKAYGGNDLNSCTFLIDGNWKCDIQRRIHIFENETMSTQKLLRIELDFQERKVNSTSLYYKTATRLVLNDVDTMLHTSNDLEMHLSKEITSLLGSTLEFNIFHPLSTVDGLQRSEMYEKLNFSRNFLYGLPCVKDKNILVDVLQLECFRMISDSIHQLKITHSTHTNRLWSLLHNMNVKEIKLSNCKFDESANILNASISDMPLLTELYINKCNVKSIAPGSFKNWRNLEILDLSENSLKSIPPGLRYLTKLKYLDLSNQKNVLQFTLNFEEFSTLSSVEKLNMSNLQIRDILKETLSPMFLLRELDLSNCGLHFLPELVLSNLTRLSHLYLSHNFFSRFFIQLFQFPAPGAYIDLRHNIIGNIQYLELKNISVLDLSYNWIASPENLIKIGYVNFLNLSYNKMTNWSKLYSFHSDYHDIKNVDLSYNNITGITKLMGRSLNFLNTVELGGNPISCYNDCSMLEFQNWLKMNTTKILIHDKSQVMKCIEPLHSRNKSIIDIKLSPNLCEHASMNEGVMIAPILISVLVITCIISIFILYVYRFELTYIRHLWNMKTRSEKIEERNRHECDYDAFVSYSRMDRDWVLDVLVPRMENPTDRYIFCLHERDFRLGSYIMDNIVNCIDRSRRVLLILSNHFLESEWCKWELRMATHRIFEDSSRDFLILIELEKLDHSKLPLSLRVLMASRTYLEWPIEGKIHRSIGRHVFWRRLQDALGTPLVVTQPHLKANVENSTKDSEEEDEDCDELFKLI